MQYGISNTTQLILANQCPFADGTAVYKARALYDLINVSNEVYYDEDCPEKGYSGRAALNNTENNTLHKLLAINETKKIAKKIHIDYILFPNPSTDEIYIRGKLSNELLNVIITDVSGRCLKKESIYLLNHQSNLKFDLLNGIYFVIISNSKNEKVLKKLIISK